MAAIPKIFENEETILKVSENELGSLSDLKHQKAFNVLRYPLDLASNPALQNYVVFYINVRERDRSQEYEKKIGTSELDVSSENRIGNVDSEDAKAAIKIGSAALLASKFGGGFLANVLSGLAVAAVSDVVNNKEVQEKIAAMGESIVDSTFGKDKLKAQIMRLHKVIALPITSNPDAKYRAGYLEVDVGILGGLIRDKGKLGTMSGLINGITTGNALDTLVGIGKAGAGPAGAYGYKNLRSNDAFGLGNVGDTLSRSLAMTDNPFKEQLFKSMDTRSFGFEYKFLPKSKDEAVVVKSIIDTFKYYMHPDMDAQNPYWLTYPAEFNIEFFNRGNQNEYLHKISSCVLTDLQVSYGSDGDFMTFKGDINYTQLEGSGDPRENLQLTNRSGYPTEITLSIQFTELEVLTRGRIGQGY